MPRLLFEKTGNAVWISHLDLMRLFQRAFKRAGLPLTHSQGYNPRPSVSIALPLSVGVESQCELLDFDLYGEKLSNADIHERLNNALVEGVRVLKVYDDGKKIKNLAYLDCCLTLEYDHGLPEMASEKISELFHREEVLVEKKSKKGILDQNIIPMIRELTVEEQGSEIIIHAKVCCQNPSLNPMQLSSAICKYLPELTPDYTRYRRMEVYDAEYNIFR